MQAEYTGGVSGTPSYSWAFVAPNSASPVAFLNPAGASSQVIRFTGLPPTSVRVQGVQVTITDAATNASQQTANATVERD